MYSYRRAGLFGLAHADTAVKSTPPFILAIEVDVPKNNTATSPL